MNERIHKYFYEELSTEERLSLLRDVEASEELKKEFAEYQNLYALLNLGHQVQDKAIGKQKYDRFILQKQHAIMWKRWTRRIGYAAAILILVVSTSILTYWYAQPEQTEFLSENVMNTVYAPAGQRAQLVLLDGTEVWLNAGSRLDYPSAFAEERRVYLTGEGFFKVAKDKTRPFVVSTQTIDIKALGTEFNVLSYPKSKYAEVSLQEGSVKAYFPESESEGLILSPGQLLVQKGDSLKLENMNWDELLWKKGIYVFRKQKLETIIEKLALYFNVDIIVRNPEILEYEYVGKFRQRDGIMTILKVIQDIHHFKIEKNDELNQIVLSK